MAFKIAARTILELGAELISSDGVALYELIKNAIDADSSRVEIRVVVTLTHSNYLALLERIDHRFEDLETLRKDILGALEKSAPEKIRIKLEKLIEVASTADELREALVKGYDSYNWIKIIDQGEGMSYRDLEEVYLTIGTRSRQRKKIGEQASAQQKIYLGEKGVGRLSVMRLGRMLSVTTSRVGDDNLNLLKIDWDLFSHESDALLHEIDVHPTIGEKKEDPNKSGTVIKISGLRSDWAEYKFRTIIVDEFSRLVDPFEGSRANEIFRLFYNGERHYVPEIERRLFDIAHAECKASFDYDQDNVPTLRGIIDYRLRNKKMSFSVGLPELLAITSGIPLSALRTLGPFDLEFWWYNRLILRAVEGIGKKQDVLALVRKWSGGIMLFRDGFRINPYGGADDDWLELDKKAFSSRGFKLNRQQIVGRAVISWRNRFLIEQTNREGLTDTVQKSALQRLLQYVLLNEFKVFVDSVDKEVRIQELSSMEEVEQKIMRADTEIEKKIKQIYSIVPVQHQKMVHELKALIGNLTDCVNEARALAEEYQDDRAKFVYLAGLGLSIEFILHELARSTHHVLDTLSLIDKNTLSGRLPSVINNLTEQLRTISKRVDTLDPLSTSRRQNKENFDVYEIIRQASEAREAQAKRHSVKIEGSFVEKGEHWKIKAVKGMFIQILENLLANSFYWLKVQKEIERDFRPKIEIEVDPDSKTISLTDNGPGIDPKQSERIFEAFVTEKPPGQGKGLGLYISREIAEYHGWRLSVLKEETVRKRRYNTFVLDLSEASS